MIAGVSVAVLAAIVFVSIVGGTFRGFAGFGSGLIMAPIMTWLIEPAVAVPAMLVMSFAASGRLLPDAWPDIDWRRVALIAVPAVITVPLGAWLLTDLDPYVLQKSVSALVLLMVIVLARGWRYPGVAGAPVLVPAGLVSGVLTAVGGVGGPPVVTLMMAEDSEPQKVRANLIGFFVISQIASLVTFLVRGVLNTQVMSLALICAPLFLLSIHLGTRLFRGRLQGNYRTMALGLLAIVAIGGLAL